MIDLLFAALLASGAAKTPPTDAGTSVPLAPSKFKHPIQISAPRFEIDGKRQRATYSGGVTAIRGTTVLTCDRLVAEFTAAQEVTRLSCVGGVEAKDNDRWAQGERAEFDNASGLLVVTGNPQARQGPNRMTGTKVTFHVGRDVIEVENARTVFETSRKKKKAP